MEVSPIQEQSVLHPSPHYETNAEETTSHIAIQSTPQNSCHETGFYVPPFDCFGNQNQVQFQSSTKNFEVSGDKGANQYISSDSLDLLWQSFDQDWNNGLVASPVLFNHVDFFNMSSTDPVMLSEVGGPGTGDVEALSMHRNLQNERTRGGVLSRYASRLPSVEPGLLPHQSDHQRDQDTVTDKARYQAHARVSYVSQQDHQTLRFSQEDYAAFAAALQAHHELLHREFKIPSRHALNRYLEGFVSSFCKHLPFIHTPSMRISTMPLDLLLAVVSVGAQYRFERRAAIELYKVSKAIVLFNTSSYVTNVTYTPLREAQNIATPQTISTPASVFNSGTNTDFSALKTEGANQCGLNVKFTTIQAMVVLITLCTWNHKSMLKDGYTMATQLASILREDGHLCRKEHRQGSSWEHWIEIEGRRRTILVAFWLMNLASIVHHSPPRLLNRDIFPVYLAMSEEEWKACSANEWVAAHARCQYKDVSFGEAYTALFTDLRLTGVILNVSSFGNLTLIHAIFQRIYLSWESVATCFTGASEDGGSSLPAELARKIQTALGRWKLSWESTKESSLQPVSPSGTLGFNATALYRIAHIRLHLNLGPHRRLETRDPVAIAHAFSRAPRPARTPQVYRALLQGIHSLSIPVRVGLEYVARTQTLDWSLVHAVCNLECALLLSKWLETISHGQRLCEEELRLLTTVAGILEEAGLLTVEGTEDHGAPDPKQLAVAVIQLVAAIFKGNHAWELWGSLRSGLQEYITMVETATSAAGTSTGRYLP